MNENVLNRPTLIKFPPPTTHPQPTFDNLNGIPVNETPTLPITSISFTPCRRRNFIANFFSPPSLPPSHTHISFLPILLFFILVSFSIHFYFMAVVCVLVLRSIQSRLDEII